MDQGFIKLSNDILMASEEDSSEFFLIDPKTCGVLDTYSADGKIAAKKAVVSERFGHILVHLRDKTILEFYNTGSLKPYIRCSLPEILTSFRLSNDNYLFYGGGASGMMYIWDTMNGEQLRKFKAHSKTVTKIVVSEDGGLIVTAGADLVINVWLFSQIFQNEADWRYEINANTQELSNFRPIYTLIRHMGVITDLALSPKSISKLVSTSVDKACIFWDCYKGTMIKDIRCESEINCLHYDYFGDRVYLGCKNSKIYLYFLNEKANDLKLDAMGQSDKVPKKFDIRKQSREKTEFVGHEGEVHSLVYYAELKLLISGGGDGKIIFWNLEGSIVKQMALFKKAVGNLIIFERPKEYDSTFASAQKIKKFVEFKAFRKHEDKTNQNTDFHVLSIFPEQKIEEEAPVQSTTSCFREYVDLTLDFFLSEKQTITANVSSSNAMQIESGQQVIATGNQNEIDSLRLENAKLKALAQELFNKCYSQGKC